MRPLSLRAASVLVFFVAVIAYANSLPNDFVWDDAYNVVQNEPIRDLGNIPEFFTEAWGAGAASEHSRALNTNYWRPVVLVSYAIDYALFGLEPLGFHATNVLLHGVCSGLLLMLGWLLWTGGPRERWGVCVGALLFAVHPLHTEVVNVITYRTDLLAALFTLIAMVIWLRAPRRPVYLMVVLPVLYACGLGAKEMAITLPALLVVLDRVTARTDWRRLAVQLSPMLVVLGLYMVLRSLLLEPSSMTYFSQVWPAGLEADGASIFWTMASVFGLYGRLFLMPWPLNPFYDWSETVLPIQDSPWTVEVLAGVVLLAALLLLMWRWRTKAPKIVACIGLYLLILIPVSQLVPIIVAAGERFLYLAIGGPLLGLGVMAARRLSPRVFIAIAVVCIGSCASMTVVRNADWRTDETILEANVDDWPDSFNAWFGLATLRQKLALQARTSGNVAQWRHYRAKARDAQLQASRLYRDAWRRLASKWALDANHWQQLERDLVMPSSKLSEAQRLRWQQRAQCLKRELQSHREGPRAYKACPIQ